MVLIMLIKKNCISKILLTFPIHFVLIFGVICSPLYSYENSFESKEALSTKKMIKQSIKQMNNSSSTDELVSHFVGLKNSLAQRGVFLPNLANACLKAGDKLKSENKDIDDEAINTLYHKVFEKETNPMKDQPYKVSEKDSTSDLSGNDLYQMGQFKIIIGIILVVVLDIVGIPFGVYLIVSGYKDIKLYKRELAEKRAMENSIKTPEDYYRFFNPIK